MTISETCRVLTSGVQYDITDVLKAIENNPQGVKLEDKPKLVDTLLTQLAKRTWDEQTLTQGLSVLKLLGRSTQGADALYSEKGTIQLMKITGLDDIDLFQDTPSTQEGLKCLANCILLDEKVKTYLANNQGAAACGRLFQSNHLSMTSQFLICRILFFMTVNNSRIAFQLMDYDIALSTTKLLTENVNHIISSSIDTTPPINPISVTNEGLKMLFNLLLAHASQQENSGTTTVDDFRGCLLPILQIIFLIPPPQPLPLSPPHSHAIHALMQYPCPTIVQMWTQHRHVLFPNAADDDECHALVTKKITSLLHRSLLYLMPPNQDDELQQQYNVDAVLSPIMLVIRNISLGDLSLRPLLASALLPQQSDRMMPVHQGEGLPAYLIRLMTSATLPQTRDAVCETIFVLCDQDADQFTRKVGYGNAIGFLMNKGIAIAPPGNQQDNQDNNDPSLTINPITGQYVSAEQPPALADMTDEEKEREAEKLFVLFERLKKTGIIDVENPVAKAMREGGTSSDDTRIQELDSDDDDHS